MGIADEIRKLQDLHASGALSDDEFAQAKATLLNNPPTEARDRNPLPQLGDSLGDAAKMWVQFRIVMAVVGLILAAIFFFGFLLPSWNGMHHASPFPFSSSMNFPRP